MSRYFASRNAYSVVEQPLEVIRSRLAACETSQRVHDRRRPRSSKLTL
jgi:hypothetical protein